jgi:peptidyl-prolyl cis-trans isomerase D
MTKQKKHEVMQDIIQEEVFWQEAKKYGITVTDSEISMEIQHYPAFQKDGKFDQRAYFQVLNQVLHSTPQEFEESRRRQIAYLKLRDLVASSVILSEPELRYAYMKANKNNMKNFDKDRETFVNKTRQEKVMMVFNEWFKQLNQGLKVKIYLKDEPTA